MEHHDSLADSAWMRAVSRYLAGSIRAGAYAANLYLMSLVDSSVASAVPSQALRTVAYLAFGAIVYEVIARVVKARYKPSFVCETESGAHAEGRLVLNKTDYAYRTAAETLIYEVALYYGITLVLALVLCKLVNGQMVWSSVGLALLGAFLSVFNFFGVVILSTSGSSFSLKHLPTYLAAVAFMTPLFVYLAYTLRWCIGG